MNRLSHTAAIDVHQHLWPAQLLEALRARRRAPRLRGWTLELEGEPEYRVDPVTTTSASAATRRSAMG